MEKENIIENIVEGRNPVLEAIKSGRTIDKILVQKGAEGSIKKIIAIARENKIVIQEVMKNKLDELSETGSHQGIVAYVSAHEYVEVDDILAYAKEKNEMPFVIVLDGITDPHNLGAIIRTANLCGAHGIIIPKRRAVGLTSTVAKASAGAIEYTKIAKVSNINSTLEDLKKSGLWTVCADMSGTNMYTTDLKMPVALVIGDEGEGVSRLVKENCDFHVSIPMYGQISSLNASVSAGILMYEIVRQRNFK